MRIDHVTFAGPSLDALRDAFAQLGMATDYGGVHSNGVTHMAVLGFDDGSYLELISTLQRGQPSPWWHEAIVGDAGPCGVAVQCDDVAAEVQRLRALGIAVRGPIDMSRQTPSGDTASWTLAFIGDGEPGATLPFIIQDRSPREVRVQPTQSITGSELTGIARVVLAVHDFDATIRLSRAAYAWPVPQVMDDESLGTRIAHWGGRTPYVIADALRDEAMYRRVTRFGDGPCAFLLRSRDLQQTVRSRPVSHRSTFCGHEVAWFDLNSDANTRLGAMAF